MSSAFLVPSVLPLRQRGPVLTRRNSKARFVTPHSPDYVRLPQPTEHKNASSQELKASAALITHLQLSAAVTVLYQALFFGISTYFKTGRLIDIAGTSNIALLALLSLYLCSSPSLRHILVSAAVVVWALRLGFFLGRRIAVWKHDRRVEPFRSKILLWAGIWLIQCVWVWATALPVTTLGTATLVQLSWSDIPAATLFLLGLTLEAVADAQKESARNRKGWPEKGLWRYSRHPNYFGEMLIWWGIFLATLPALHGLGFIAILSPVLVMLMLLFFSGVPLLEQSADEKFGDDPEYDMYKAHTSVLVPFPPQLYEKLPPFVKRGLFLDLAMYNSIQKEDS